MSPFAMLLCSALAVGVSPRQAFQNEIVSGKACNNLGNEQFIKNKDASHSYSVTVKISSTISGSTTESEMQFPVAAGGTTYLGCSIGVSVSASYKYAVVGEKVTK